MAEFGVREAMGELGLGLGLGSWCGKMRSRDRTVSRAGRQLQFLLS